MSSKAFFPIIDFIKSLYPCVNAIPLHVPQFTGNEKKYGKNREEIMGLLAGARIQSRPLWYLNHLQEPYKDCQAYRIEKACDMLDKTLNIPCSVGLKEEEVRKVISILKH